MIKNSTVRIITAFVAALFLAMSASANAPRPIKKSQAKKAAAQSKCSWTSDDDIVKSIKEKFEADAQIKDQMRHVNVSVKKRRVTLEGWLDGRAAVRKAAALARKTPCVKMVTSRLRARGGGSCGPGLRPCGDTCIDRRSQCTIDG